MSRIILPHIITDDSAIGGSVIERSLVNAEDRNRYLSYTPSAAGDQRTFTLSGWFKIYQADGNQDFIWMCGTSSSNRFQISREGVEQINFEPKSGGSDQARFYTSNKFNDPTAWYHFVFKADTTQGTSSDRYNFYINGVETEYGGTGGEVVTTSYPSQNTQFLWGSTIEHRIGRRSYNSDTADIGIAELHYTSGYAYDATAFGYFDDQTGIWKPKKFTGSYGSAGWHLDFSDTTSTTTLGYDKSGNGNHWTLNNYSTDNAILDTPTNNFPVWNPTTLTIGNGSDGTLTNGNLEWLGTGGNDQVIANLSVKSGKWYYEVKVGQNPSTFDCGWTTTEDAARDRLTAISYYNLVGIRSGKTITWDSNPTVVSYTTNDIIGLALNLDDNLLYMYKNGSLLHTQSVPTDKGDTFIPMCGDSSDNDASGIVNFGQDSSFTGDVTKQGNKDANGIGDFYYPVPSGYKALCSVNLPPTVSSVIRPQRHHDTLLYTGTGSSNIVEGLEFEPDMIWVHARDSNGLEPMIVDSVRGGTKSVVTSSNDAESTHGGRSMTFYPNGVRWNSDSNTCNANGENYVLWCWKAGGAAVANNDGTIATQVSANQEAGFSIVTYTGTNSNGATIGHGLGKVPAWFIIKRRDSGSSNWMAYHQFLNGAPSTGGLPYTHNLYLNTTDGKQDDSHAFNDTAPTSSVITLGISGFLNASGGTYVAYCWAEIPGYSKFGIYEGTDNSDGSYIHLGFRPAWLMIRKTASEDWVIYDVKRNTRNEIGQGGRIYADLAQQESSTTKDMDFHSSGFKLRKATGIVNTGSSDYIYMAFAEKPDLTPFNAVPTAKS